MTGLLIFLAVIYGIYFGFKYGLPLLMRYVLKRASEKIMNQAQQQSQGRDPFQRQREQQQNSQAEQEGKIRVSTSGQQEQQVAEGAGEYIDFEEVK
ncbi:DUF4834 family protein [Chitinophagales bacterium]|nr:DUF4834 family protein [Chitinophagales bacterium]